MADLQQTVDGLRFRLAGDGFCELDDELRQLAADYNRACRVVNTRLRRCGDFLRRDLRSEAIQLAESEPRLLDLVALLDFPEREQWEEVASVYDLPRGEPLLLEVAAELNEAYAAEQPLQALLSRHRLLALARAPLPLRIATLRRLDALDPGTPLWDEDLRAFEEARLRDIAREADAAARERDLCALEKLNAEVTEPGWRISLPAEIVERVHRLLAGQVRRDARQQLEELAVALNDALNALDAERGRELRDRWRALARTAALSINDPLQEEVAPALGWLEDEDGRVAEDAAWQQAVAKLERGLTGRQAATGELVRLGHEVVRHHREIPEPLATRYRHHLEAAQAADRRRRVLVLGGTAAGIALLIGLIGWGIVTVRHNASLRRVSEAVEKQLAAGQPAEARRLYEENGTISTGAAWLELRQRIAQAESAEQQRAGELRAHLESARETQEHATATKALEQARGLARTSDEKAAVVQLERLWDERHGQAVAEREADFRRRMEELSQNVVRLEGLLRDGPGAASLAEATTLAAEMQVRFAELQQVETGLRPEQASQSQVLRNRFATLDERREATKKRQSLFARLDANAEFDAQDAEAVRKLQAFADALTEYRKAFPEEPRSEQFGEAADEAPLWNGIVAWRKLQGGFVPFLPRDLAEAAARTEQCAAHLKTYGTGPFAARAAEYRGHLETVAWRVTGGSQGEALKDQLRRTFSGDLLRDVFVLEDRDGNIYYVKEEKEFAGKTATFKYVVGYGNQMRTKTVLVTELKSLGTRAAPQAALAEQLRRDTDRLAVNDWEGPCRSIVERILAADGVDSLLRYQLLMQTLQIAGQGSPPLEQRLSAARKRFQDDEIDQTVRWMDPENAAAGGARGRAAAALGRTDGLLDAWEGIDDDYERMQRKLFPEVRFIGWLCRDGNGRWTCRTSWSTEVAHRLFVAASSGSGAAGELAPVGRAWKGGLVLDPSLQDAFREGRPVLAMASEGGE